MEPRLSDLVEMVVPRAMSDLLSSYAGAVTMPPPGGVPPVVTASDLCGALTPFVGYGCSGSLLLVAPFGFFARSYPDKKRSAVLSASSQGDWILIRDWSGELCNQLLGRIKNTLIPNGLTLTSRTPQALSGEPLSRAMSSRMAHEVSRISGSDVVRAWFDITTARDFHFGRPVADSADVPKEGSVIVF